MSGWRTFRSDVGRVRVTSEGPLSAHVTDGGVST